MKVHDDPEGLKDGQEVVMGPTDTGYNSKDSGKLIHLDAHESVVSTTTQQDGREIHIHYPRWNFSIEGVKE